VVQAAVEEAFRPPLARLASQNFAVGAEVAEVYDDNKYNGASSNSDEPGVEIVKPVKLPLYLEFLLNTSIQFAIQSFFTPFSKILNCFTCQPELMMRGLITKEWTSLSETFFNLGALEGTAALFRGSGYGAFAHFTYRFAHDSISRLAGKDPKRIRQDCDVMTTEDFLTCSIVDGLALACSFSLFSIKTILTTDFATDTHPRLYSGGLDVIKKAGFANLYRGFGYALAASFLRDVAVLLRKKQKRKLSWTFLTGWALVIGICPFFEMAVTRSAVGGLQHQGLPSVARQVFHGPWTIATLLMRM